MREKPANAPEASHRRLSRLLSCFVPDLAVWSSRLCSGRLLRRAVGLSSYILSEAKDLNHDRVPDTLHVRVDLRPTAQRKTSSLFPIPTANPTACSPMPAASPCSQSFRQIPSGCHCSLSPDGAPTALDPPAWPTRLQHSLLRGPPIEDRVSWVAYPMGGGMCRVRSR